MRFLFSAVSARLGGHWRGRQKKKKEEWEEEEEKEEKEEKEKGRRRERGTASEHEASRR